MTDVEIKEVADSFMKIGDSIHEIMAISINEVLSLAKEVEGLGFGLETYCKDILVLRSCNSVAAIESEVKKWIDADGLLVKT